MRRVDIDPTTGCYLWRGKVNPDGYGELPHRGRHSYPAHRFVYEALIEFPGKRFVLHKCDVRRCVNPEHLYLGTPADNVRDMKDRDRCYRGDSRTKLTWDDACAIREAAARGESKRGLARKYGVDVKTIHQVVLGISWNSSVRTRRVKRATLAE